MRAGVIALIAAFAGCCPATPPRTPEPVAIAPAGPPGSCKAARLSRRGCKKAWTVLVYMAADASDLGEPARRDLAAMEASGSTDEADVIVQLDRKDPAGILRLHVLPAPAGSTGEITSPIVEVMDEETIAPDESLRRFVSWGVDRYPSDRYAVVVWGHGLGYRPAPRAGAGVVRYDPASDDGGLAFDESQGTVLDTPGLRRALIEASKERLGGKPFDLYASDACLMQSIEVAAELEGAARFVVGSEQIEEDYLGLPYRAWLPMLHGSTPLPAIAGCAGDDIACRAAAVIPSLQATQATAAIAPGAPRMTDGYTLSTIDEAALTREALPAMRRLAGAIDAYLREDPLRRVGIEALLKGNPPLRAAPAFRGGMRDIGIFLARVERQIASEPGAAGTKATTALREAIAAARAAIGRAVITSASGPRFQKRWGEALAGLSVWLPRDAEEHRARVDFFAASALHRAPAGEPSFRAMLDRVFPITP